MGYRYLVFVAVCLLLLVYGTILYKIPRNKEVSISQHIAERKATFLITAFAFSTYGVLMYFFFLRWLRLALDLPAAFTLLVYIMTLATLVTAWVPDDGRRLQQVIHRWAAYGGMAAMAVFMLFTIGIFGELSLALRVLTLLSGLFMVYCIGLYIFVKSARRYYLVYQSAYALSFFLTLIVVSLFHR